MDEYSHQPRPGEASRPAPEPGEEPLPWEGDPPPAEERGPDGRRIRHDAFTARRKHDFLAALAKTGCLEDAARAVGVTARTVYRHQEKDPAFAEHCRIAVRMSATPLELTAWARAVEGVEQEFACGGQIHVRRRYDGSLLRLLLQGSNPKKYGARPGFKRKRLYRHEKKRMEKEIRAELAAEAKAKKMTFNDAIHELDRRLQAFGVRRGREKTADGWTQSPEGDWIPPGYGPLPGFEPPPRDGEGGEPPCDSM